MTFDDVTLRKYGLPPGFCRDHREWSIPSRRARYWKMVDDSSGGRGDSTFAITTMVSGDYQWYVPLFLDRCRKEVPSAVPMVYVRGSLELGEPWSKMVKAVDDHMPISGLVTAAARFLWSDQELESFDYVLITDADLMLMAEQPSYVDQHVSSMRANETGCYDNYEVADPKEPCLIGIHFVQQKWWDTTRDSRARHSELLKTDVTYKGYDERLLAQIAYESGLPRATRIPQMWNHHGLHLGLYRDMLLRHESRYDPPEAKLGSYMRKLLDDSEFMSLVQDCGKHIPTLCPTFEYFTRLCGC